MGEDVSQYPKYWLPDKAYGVLKWVGLLALPAIGWLYQAVGSIWGLPHVGEVSMTISAIGTAIGVLIGASQLTKDEGGGADGEVG